MFFSVSESEKFVEGGVECAWLERVRGVRRYGRMVRVKTSRAASYLTSKRCQMRRGTHQGLCTSCPSRAVDAASRLAVSSAASDDLSFQSPIPRCSWNVGICRRAGRIPLFPVPFSILPIASCGVDVKPYHDLQVLSAVVCCCHTRLHKGATVLLRPAFSFALIRWLPGTFP